MKLRTLTLTLCLTTPWAITMGCATTQPAGEQTDDAVINTMVASKIAADPDLRKYDIDVDTTQEVVTLRGNVENETDKAEAETLARNTRGVRSVDNQLSVGTDADLGDGNPDLWITTKVKSQLVTDDDVRTMNVDVDTDDRVVTLSGIVRSETAKQDAERIARNVEGVEDVVNQLKVEEQQAEDEQDE